MITLKYFDKFIYEFANLPLKERNIFEKIELTNEEVKEIAKRLKVNKNLIRRSLLIFKYSIISPEFKDIYLLFKKQCQDLIFKWNRGDFEVDYILQKNKKGPFIFFHDEPEFDVQRALDELKYLNNTEQSSSEKLETLFAELEKELSRISMKCLKIVNSYREQLNIN
jgi:hypothetical protein